MKSDLKTIFSKSTLPPSGSPETKKINYWLERLFNQEKQHIEKEEQEKISDELQEIPTKDLPTDSQPVQIADADQSAEEKGVQSAQISQSKQIEVDKQRLENMVTNSNRILISTSSIFPFDLFPTTINVEATRVTIIHRQLFSSQVHSVDIKDISNVFIETGILFATITLISSTFVENDIKIGRIWKKQAILVRRIIEGLRMFSKENIDTTNYTVDELNDKLKELSTTKIDL